MTEMHIHFLSISTAAPNEDDNTAPWIVEDETVDTNEVKVANPFDAGLDIVGMTAQTPVIKNGVTYHFAFWSAEIGGRGVPNYPKFVNDLTIKQSDVPDLQGVGNATAWYVAEGGNGTGQPHLRVRTFDVDLNNFRKETAISASAPAAAWAGPNNHSVATANAAVTATLENSLKFAAPSQAQPPGTQPKMFEKWHLISGTPAASPTSPTQPSIKCDRAKSEFTIAFYGADPSKQPKLPPVKQYIDDDPLVDLWIKLFGPEVAGPHNPDAPHTPKVQILRSPAFATFRTTVNQTLGLLSSDRQRSIAVQNIKAIAKQAH